MDCCYFWKKYKKYFFAILNQTRTEQNIPEQIRKEQLLCLSENVDIWISF